MALCGKQNPLAIVSYLFISCFILAETRIHKLHITDDDRKQIALTTFGFLDAGYLHVNVTDLSVSLNVPNLVLGFTLDKTRNAGVSSYLESKQNRCIFGSVNGIKAEDSIVFFQLDFKNKRINVQKKTFDNLVIKYDSYGPPEASTLNSRVRREDKDGPSVNDTKSVHDVWPSTKAPSLPDKTATTESPIKAKPRDNNTKRNQNDKEIKEKEIKDSEKTEKVESPAVTSSVAVVSKAENTPDKLPISTEMRHVVDKIIPLQATSGPLGMVYNFSFSTYIGNKSDIGLYNLYFHNCNNTRINFTIHLTEKNGEDYLSAGHAPLPMLYVILCLCFFVAGCIWLYVIRTSTEGVFKIHYLMLVLVYVKSISTLFHAINYYFIAKTGHHDTAFAILYYITYLMRGILLFVTIVLIGAGWAIVKHILSDRDKKIFIIVIPLQILANVAQIIIEQSEEGETEFVTWKQVFILVDLLCCGAILFPVVWSIRHLQEASQTDGKVAINLNKLKLFRHFYILIVCYIYFTRIIVYLMRITVPFQYEWLDELFKETAALAFYMTTGYKFRPASNNPYLLVSTDDDDLQMDEIVTTPGAYDSLTKVNVKIRSGSEEIEGRTMPSKREASHEYD